MSEQIDIEVGDGTLPAVLWQPGPDTANGAGIVLVQEIFGLSEYIRRRGQQLADLGYVVLAPAVFWRLGTTAVPNGPQMLDEALALAGRVDWPTAVSDVAAAVRALRAREDVTGDVGIVGFCFGGGLGFAVAAVAAPDALVSYYGSALPTLLDLAPQVTCPSLHHFGSADAYIDGPTQERIREAVTGNPQTEFYTYEGANHAFDNADFFLYDEDAARAAWPRTVDFLRRHLSA
ncbi:MAG: dienelactone hydrolase family protein [Dermatophilaceae bacterium]